MLVSIIIPALNEADTILDVISGCLMLSLRKEIIVVDNNSTDGTYRLVENFVAEGKAGNVVHLLRESARGKGAARRKGLKRAKGDAIVFQDADCEYNPASITALVENLNEYDAVFGCRVGRPYDISTAAFIANKLIIFLLNRRFHALLSDVLTGQRAFRRSALNHIGPASTGFDVETELTIKTLTMGYKWRQIDVPYSPRDRKNGKKIGLLSFISILYRCLVLSRRKTHLIPTHGSRQNDFKHQNG